MIAAFGREERGGGGGEGTRSILWGVIMASWSPITILEEDLESPKKERGKIEERSDRQYRSPNAFLSTNIGLDLQATEKERRRISKKLIFFQESVLPTSAKEREGKKKEKKGALDQHQIFSLVRTSQQEMGGKKGVS